MRFRRSILGTVLFQCDWGYRLESWGYDIIISQKIHFRWLWDSFTLGFFFFFNTIFSLPKCHFHVDETLKRQKTSADTPKPVSMWTGALRDNGKLSPVHQAGRFCVSYLKDAVTRCCRGGEKRRHKEQWQLKTKKDVAAFGYQCVDLCEGRWRQLHSHSPLRAKVKNTAICHYTKPELYLAGAILRKLWRFILQGLILEQSYLEFPTRGKITHIMFYTLTPVT